MKKIEDIEGDQVEASPLLLMNVIYGWWPVVPHDEEGKDLE